MRTTTRGLEQFADQKTVILTTYRRDGRPVDTPVHIAVDGRRAFVRTYEGTGKIKRLRRRPEAELWPASNGRSPAALALLRRGAARRVGAPVRVRVTELRGEAFRRAGAALARRYPLLHGVVIPLAHRLQRTPTINLELVETD
ncbi:MAG TPA: pyridoxamine 5'-phosphate oxidase family protein [Candidatus Dormibacteraeota bacterium]|nr:pyridoxamine 5'-phosphate oxidase family protein [Candidatus Dormibacteraeota bacterium]